MTQYISRAPSIAVALFKLSLPLQPCILNSEKNYTSTYRLFRMSAASYISILCCLYTYICLLGLTPLPSPLSFFFPYFHLHIRNIEIWDSPFPHSLKKGFPASPVTTIPIKKMYEQEKKIRTIGLEQQTKQKFCLLLILFYMYYLM